MVGNELQELLLLDAGALTVLLGLDRSSSTTAEKKRDFSKEVTSFEILLTLRLRRFLTKAALGHNSTDSRIIILFAGFDKVKGDHLVVSSENQVELDIGLDLTSRVDDGLVLFNDLLAWAMMLDM